MHYVDRQTSLFANHTNGICAHFCTGVRFERRNQPAGFRSRVTGDAVTRAEIQNSPAIAWSKQAHHFRKLFTARKALGSGEHRQVEIVVANFRFVFRLLAKPSDGFFPRQSTHGSIRSSSVRGLMTWAGFPPTMVH